ncbi:hypothetical protein [Segeticoccus rhizosphaerae]|nr:hypothetical protein [Segeticoccus rhizosphaerae]
MLVAGLARRSHLISGGHFLVESAVDEVEPLISDFLDRHLSKASPDA